MLLPISIQLPYIEFAMQRGSFHTVWCHSCECWRFLDQRIFLPSLILLVSCWSHPQLEAITLPETVRHICNLLQRHPSLKKTNLTVSLYFFQVSSLTLPRSILNAGGRRSSIPCIDRTLSCKCGTQPPGNPPSPIPLALSVIKPQQAFEVGSRSVASLIKVIEENPSVSFSDVGFLCYLVSFRNDDFLADQVSFSISQWLN